MFLSREMLLKKENLAKVKVEFPGEGFVYVRQMTGHEREVFEKLLMKETKNTAGELTVERSLDDFRAKVAVCTVCDGTGELIFQPNDYSELSRSMSASKLALIADKAQGLNRLTRIEQEELLKNSEAGQEDNSSSGSAEN